MTDPLFMKVGGQYYFYQNDHLGTPQKLTAVNGAVVWSAKYSSFGEAEVDLSSTVTNNLRFAGQYYDQETGLHYNFHRFYDPIVGRYLKTDPIGYEGGANVYVYVESNPVNWLDPFGLARKPGKTPPSSWPPLPENVGGKKPKWNPEGYWDGKKGRRVTWDDRSHGAGVDRGQGEQGGHWDDENSDNRWDENGNLLPGSPDLKENKEKKEIECVDEIVTGVTITVIIIDITIRILTLGT